MAKIKYLLIICFLSYFAQSCTQETDDNFLEFYWDQTGCADPWQNTGGNSEEELKVTIENYLKTQGVSGARVKDITNDALPQVCLACFCTTGRRIFVEVPLVNKNTMLALGFQEFN